MKPRDFRSDLAWSEEASCARFWERVYAEMFPGCKAMMNNANNQAQRRGIDTLLLLPSGSTQKIQEKKRRENWPDILIEFKHIDSKGRQWSGWMEEEPQADWLAYAFIPSERCYFFPWPSLQKAWRELKRVWFAKAKLKEDGFCLTPPSLNAGPPPYYTHNIAVPIPILMECVKWAQVISLGDEPPPVVRIRQGSFDFEEAA